MSNQFLFETRNDWRLWLEKNYDVEKAVWVEFYKKHTGKKCLQYNEAVEEAICFGWIDSIKKRVDDEKYSFKFSPRRNNSKWSQLNINRAKKMIQEEKMTSFGLEFFNKRKTYSNSVLDKKNEKNLVIPEDIEEKFKINKKVWKNFENLAPSHRKQYILWISSAKKLVTKEKRIAEAMELLEKNQKLGLK